MDERDFSLEDGSEPRNEFYSKENENEMLETTKEVVELKDLIPEGEDATEDYEKAFDESSRDADLIFQTEVETKEKINAEKKENIFKKWKKKWNGLSKKNKILFVSLGIFLVLLVVFLIVFLVILLKKPEEAPKEPDIILEMDNYRYENGKLIFLDENESEIGEYECINKNENLCAVATLQTDETMDTIRRVDEDGKSLHFRSKIYFDRFVFLRDSSSAQNIETKIYDIKNKEIVDTVIEVLQTPEYDGYFVTKNNDGYYALLQFTESEVKIVIPYASAYEEMHMVPGSDALSMVAVRKDQNYYVANLLNQVSKAVTLPIVGANSTHIKSKDIAGKYQIYDYNGKKINEEMYDYVELLDDVYIGIFNKSVVLKDYEEHMMGLQEVTLKNTNYIPKATIKDGKTMETVKTFDYEKQDHILNFNVYDGISVQSYRYDLWEGNLSQKLAYMNYFDGKLYFYEDQEKTKLLGSYQCTNRNEVEEKTEALSVCAPAIDSVLRETRNEKENGTVETGIIPIFYKRYIFIQDGDRIVLYDLTSSEEKAPYETVDTSSYTGLKELSFQNQDMVFIAKSNNSSKFGVVKISKDKVESVISFEKESILKLGDYYVVQENGKYSLYDESGKKVTTDTPSPIVDYHKNYMKTLNGDNYYVYSFEDEITSEAYSYVELYDHYFATVKNAILYVYSYEDPKKNYIKDDNGEGLKLNLPSDKYYGQTINAFKITFDDENIYVQLGETNGTYQEKIAYPIHPKEVIPEPEETDPTNPKPSEEDENSEKPVEEEDTGTDEQLTEGEETND